MENKADPFADSDLPPPPYDHDYDYDEDEIEIDRDIQVSIALDESLTPSGVRNRKPSVRPTSSADAREDIYSIQNTDLARAKDLVDYQGTGDDDDDNNNTDKEEVTTPLYSNKFALFHRKRSPVLDDELQTQPQSDAWTDVFYAYATWLSRGDTMADLVFLAVGIELLASLGFMIYFFVEASTWTFSGETGVLIPAVLYTGLLVFVIIHYFSELIYYLYYKKSILDTAPVDTYRMALSLRSLTVWCVVLTFILLWVHYGLGVGFDPLKNYERDTLHNHGASNGDLALLHYGQRPAYSLLMGLYFVIQLVLFLRTSEALLQYDDDENVRNTAARMLVTKDAMSSFAAAAAAAAGGKVAAR